MKKIISIALVLMVIFSFAACSASNNYTTSAAASPQMAYDSYEMNNYREVAMTTAAYAMANPNTAGGGFDYGISEMEDSKIMAETAISPPVSPPSPGGESEYRPETERKIIRNADLNLETIEFDASLANLTAYINSIGGYISSSNVGGRQMYYNNNRYANITARIPAAKYQEFLDGSSQFGNVSNISQHTEDISTQYYDTESRVASLKVQQERLMSMLEKAENVEQLLQIENELTNVRYQLENFTRQIRSYDSLVTYSTINLYISEVDDPTKYTTTNPTFGDQIKNAFRSSISSIKYFFTSTILSFVYNWPSIIFWVVVLVVIFIILRKKTRKNKTALPPVQGGDIQK